MTTRYSSDGSSTPIVATVSSQFDRFAPAFHGATWQQLVDNLEVFNSWVERLWRGTEDNALDALNEIFLDPSLLLGAGRSLPSMLFYLRDRERFAVCLNGTMRGLAALTGAAAIRRNRGKDGYLDFCTQAQAFARDHQLAPQEVDLVLAVASRIARATGRIGAGSGHNVLPRDAFAFLADLQADNTVAWMQANRIRYQTSLATPFRSMLEQVAEALTDVDPLLDTAVKTGHVLSSIKKQFADEQGDYHTYLWGAFCRFHKQEDVQLFVGVDPRELQFGLSFGAAAEAVMQRLRQLGEAGAETIWRSLRPFSDELAFALDGSDREVTLHVQNPTDVHDWLHGPRPIAMRTNLGR